MELFQSILVVDWPTCLVSNQRPRNPREGQNSISQKFGTSTIIEFLVPRCRTGAEFRLEKMKKSREIVVIFYLSVNTEQLNLRLKKLR